MQRFALFRVIGTQPVGITTLRVEDLYRAPNEKTAAALASNFWRLNDTKVSRLAVTEIKEPLEYAGRLYDGLLTTTFEVDDSGNITRA